MHDILPDSRLRTIHTARHRVFRGSQAWVPVFCPNCGREGPLTPEESTFIFWMCNSCFQSKGHITGTMVVPDKAYFDNLAAEQQHQFGRPATHQELLQIVAEDNTPLATLIKEAR